MELYRRQQLKLFTMFQHIMNLAILQKKCSFPCPCSRKKEGRFQERKVTAKTVVLRFLHLQLKFLLKFKILILASFMPFGSWTIAFDNSSNKQKPICLIIYNLKITYSFTDTNICYTWADWRKIFSCTIISSLKKNKWRNTAMLACIKSKTPLSLDIPLPP